MSHEAAHSDAPIYGGAPTSGASASGESAPRRRTTRIHHLAQMKEQGEKWSMLTAYDHSTARIFDEAEIPVLLVGDSAANVVLGYDTTIPVSIDELIPLARAVVRARAEEPFSRSGRLVALLYDVIPAPARRTGGHPAKRAVRSVQASTRAATSSRCRVPNWPIWSRNSQHR